MPALARGFYSVLLLLLLPVALVWLHWPKQGKPAVGKRWPEHLGIVPRLRKQAIDQKVIWIHTVSVGEVIAATPLIKALVTRYPSHQILVSTTTRTGADRVAAAFSEQVEHRYAPFDLPWGVAGFLAQTQPDVCILMEMELWPNLLAALEKRDIPSVLINARMSERSCKGYQRFSALVAPALARLSSLGVQHQDDAERLQRLGASAEHTQVTGSLKFDLQVADTLAADGQGLREQLGKTRPIWIAASTHKGEDEQVLATHRQLLKQHPEALLVLVPRHPQRFEDVAKLIDGGDLSWVRRSKGESCSGDTQVYLADTMGEMMLMFAACDIAFMGGSLVPVGGHNLLEPAALAKPCLIGPHYFNFSDITEQLREAGGCKLVADNRELAQQLDKLMTESDQQEAAGKAALSIVERNRGALDRTLDLITKEID